MTRLRAHHKLFLSYSLLVAAVVVALSLGVEATLRDPLVRQAGVELHRELALGREIFERAAGTDPDSVARALGRLTGHRVTVIGRDGTVLGDSGVEPAMVARLENHLMRPEVQAAIREGRGVTVRRSVSVDRDLLYAAAPTERGPILRFAVGIEEIDAAVARVRRQILQVGGIALGLAAILSLGFSLAVTRPLRRMRDIAAAMAGGDLSPRVGLTRRDELGELGVALDTLAAELQRRLGQLEEEREEIRALVDAMAEGVLAFDGEGRLRRANPAARRIFALGDEFRGLRPEAVNRRRGFLDLVERALAGETVAPVELAHGERHLVASAQPLPRGGAVLVFLDTTELRRLEGVRRDFVANASHELKTPLTVIRGYAETLADDDPPPELRRRFAASLKASADRLRAILDDLLDLSRIESGGWTVSAEPIRLADVVQESWRPFEEAAKARAVSFELDVAEDAAELEADPGALRQVFANLFSNALRYTPDGGRIRVTSRIGVTAHRDAEGTIGIEVSDTGSGIPAQHLDRIFERFYRVDPGRSREEGGTGLGLSIVRHLVERHGGTIGAVSEVGEGTTIRIELPRRRPDSEN